MGAVVLSRRAERDLQRTGAGEALTRNREGLESLAGGDPNLDVRPVAGAAPWHRMRLGDYRIVYRRVEPNEAGGSPARWLVARIVHRRDLERAVSTLT